MRIVACGLRNPPLRPQVRRAGSRSLRHPRQVVPHNVYSTAFTLYKFPELPAAIVDFDEGVEIVCSSCSINILISSAVTPKLAWEERCYVSETKLSAVELRLQLLTYGTRDLKTAMGHLSCVI
ncbi:uncharacterized protein LOC103993329 [Musa acuminata AAA Group]|uniref:uncharacterized protein LOC103993329 n=1 Tax=Musa acuminata AAA Group TaxID=214697 RepID=UPI0031DFAF24